jgi:hypothetical protein
MHLLGAYPPQDKIAKQRYGKQYSQQLELAEHWVVSPRYIVLF